MSGDLLLWLILAATTTQSAAWMATSSNNRQFMALAREHKVELRVSPGLTGFSIVMGLVVAAGWTVYSFQVDDWRFAAISWIPIVFGVIGRVASLGKVRQP